MCGVQGVFTPWAGRPPPREIGDTPRMGMLKDDVCASERRTDKPLGGVWFLAPHSQGCREEVIRMWMVYVG